MSLHPLSMAMTAALAETLSMLAHAAQDCEDDWYLIGSAAVVLHGGQVPRLKDVDLMMSARDADALLRRVGAQRGGAEPTERFRSLVFGIWKTPPIPVEVFGGFSLATGGKWRDVRFSAGQPVRVRDVTVYVPSANELFELLHSFGRPKDLERAKLLRV